jgi:hypothetical protein
MEITLIKSLHSGNFTEINIRSREHFRKYFAFLPETHLRSAKFCKNKNVKMRKLQSTTSNSVKKKLSGFFLN